MEITNYEHAFKIKNQEIKLLINFKNGLWTSEIIKGETGIGNCSGGTHKNLHEYLKEQEREHTHSFEFFSHKDQ
nr:hypothetical protein [uncultured Flavobacterium sp.]